MIHSPGYPGVAFTTADEGDIRGNPAERAAVAGRLGISRQWAVSDQVHGRVVVRAEAPINHGEADALFTTRTGLPLAVFTADCLGVALISEAAVGVAHAGWRGIVAGVVPALLEAMTAAGVPPERAALGPGIGPCCYEVGGEVAAQLPEHVSETTWGTVSVDLPSAVRSHLGDIPVWEAGSCTRCSVGFHSHRADATSARMATISWLT